MAASSPPQEPGYMELTFRYTTARELRQQLADQIQLLDAKLAAEERQQLKVIRQTRDHMVHSNFDQVAEAWSSFWLTSFYTDHLP